MLSYFCSLLLAASCSFNSVSSSPQQLNSNDQCIWCMFFLTTLLVLAVSSAFYLLPTQAAAILQHFSGPTTPMSFSTGNQGLSALAVVGINIWHLLNSLCHGLIPRPLFGIYFLSRSAKNSDLPVSLHFWNKRKCFHFCSTLPLDWG